MPKTIDDTVVSIEFDNKKFEKNAKQSMSTIDKLKAKLRFKKENRLSDEFNNDVKNIDISPMETALNKFSLKCSAFEIARITGIQRIVNAAISAGTNITRQLTTVPVSTGFSEYEEKMGSVQTIMSSTGASVEEVKDALEKLNVYADKTIYSFKDMTSNIGKFTNAGVELNTAVDAIRGVSNVAAISGANTAEASRAMYNLAQSLSAGYVKLIDWKSIENANMATKGFKENLLETAAAMGKVKKNADGTYKTLKGTALTATRNFNETLQEQWLTTDVLIKTLRDYADETTEIGKKAYAAAQDVKTLSMLFDTLKEAVQSGWGTTWELIIGDFEEAKSFLSEMSDVFSGFISKMADARNYLLMGGLSKQSNNWKKINNAIAKTGITTEEFNNALIDTGKKYVSNLDNILSSSGSFDESLKKGWLNADIITETFKKFNDSLSDTTKTYTEEQKEIIKELYKSASEQGGVVNNLISNIDKYGETSGRENLLAGIVNIFSAIVRIVQAIGAGINAAFGKTNSKTIYELTDRFQKFTKSLIMNDDVFTKIARTVRGIATTFKFIGDVIKTGLTFGLKVLGNLLGIVGENLLDLSANFGDWLTNTINTIRNNEKLKNGIIKLLTAVWNLSNRIKEFNKSVFNTDSIIEVISKIINFFAKVVDVVGIAIAKIKEFFAAFKNIDIESMVKKVGDFFKWFGKDFLIGTLHLDEIFTKVFKFAVELFGKVMDYLKSNFPKVTSFIADFIKGIFDFIGDLLAKLDLKSMIGKVFTKENLFYGSLVALGLGIINKIKKSLTSLFPESSIKDIADSAGNLFKNIALFVASLTMLTFIDFKSLKNVGDYLLSFLIRLTLIQKIFGKADFSNNIPYKLLAFVGGLLLVVYLISKTGSKVANGSVTVLLIIIGIISILAVIVNMIKLIDSSKAMKTLGQFGGFLDRVGSALQTLSSGLRESMNEIAKGIKMSLLGEVAKQFAIAVVILAAAIYVLAQLPIANVLVSAGVVIALMWTLMGIIAVLNKMDVKSGLKTVVPLIGLAAGMVLVAYSLSMLKDVDNAIAGAAGLAIVIAALAVIVVVMDKFGSNIATAAANFVILAAGVLIIAGAISLIGALVPPKAMLSAAISLGIISGILGVILTIIAEVGGPMAAAGAAAFDIMAAGILIMCIGLSQLAEIDAGQLIVAAIAISIIAGVMTGILSVISAIAASGVGILVLGAAVLVILAIAAAVLMMANAVKIAAEGFQIFVNAVSLLPEILDTFFNKLLDIITKSKENAELAYEAGSSLLSRYIRGVTDGIRNNYPTMEEKLSNLKSAISSYLSSETYYNKGILAGQGLMQGLSFGIINGIEGVNTAITSAFGIIDDNISNEIDTVSGNIAAKQYKFQNSGVFLMQGLNNGIVNPLGSILSLMFNTGEGMIDCLNEALGVHSPSWKTKESAENTADGFTNEITAKLPDINASGQSFGTEFLSGTQSVLGDATLGDILGTSGSKMTAEERSGQRKAVLMPEKVGTGEDSDIQAYEDYQKKKSEEKTNNKDLITGISDSVSNAVKNLGSGSSTNGGYIQTWLNEKTAQIKNFLEESSKSSGADTTKLYEKEYENYKIYIDALEKTKKALEKASPERASGYQRTIGFYEKQIENVLKKGAGYAGVEKEAMRQYWNTAGAAFAEVVSSTSNNSGNNYKSAMDYINGILGNMPDWSKWFGSGDDKDETNKNTKSILDALNQQNSILGSGLASEKSYTFVQNNYSPKALSTVEIYRQTNNQLSRLGRKGW